MSAGLVEAAWLSLIPLVNVRRLMICSILEVNDRRSVIQKIFPCPKKLIVMSSNSRLLNMISECSHNRLKLRLASA